MALIAVSTLGLAIGPIIWLACARNGRRRHLLATGAAAVAISGSALIAGPWVLLSVYLRPVIFVAVCVVVIVTAYRMRRRTSDRRYSRDAGGGHIWRFGTALVFGVVLADTLAGRLPPQGAVDLAFPLEPGQYAVLQGGNGLLLNPFHHWFASDRHAVDIVKMNPSGNRAANLAPAALTDYSTFNVAVRSPCTGTVEERQDDLPDHPPGQMDWQHPAGNHVLVRCGTVQVLLAHLRQGSLAVSAHERIRAGQLVGHIGNSGGTREPHLHIGAVIIGPGTSLLTAKAIPITVAGRYLRINDVIQSESHQ